MWFREIFIYIDSSKIKILLTKNASQNHTAWKKYETSMWKLLIYLLVYVKYNSDHTEIQCTTQISETIDLSRECRK